MYLMKKLVFSLLLVLLILTGNISFAQLSGSTWLTTSLGLNSCWLLNQNAYGNQEMDYATTFGIQGTIGANYYINSEYGISTGVGFGNFGQNYQGDQGGATATRKVHLNYIQVPIFGMKQLCDPQTPCWLTFGPQLMFLTSATQNYTRDAGNPLPHPEYLPEGKKDVTKWYKPADVMLNLGYTKVYMLRTSDNVRMMWSVNGAMGIFDVNAKDYQIENIHGEYKSSHNFYIGAQIGLMFNP